MVEIRSIYFSVISDYVGGEEWDQHFLNIRESRSQLVEVIKEFIIHIDQS